MNYSYNSIYRYNINFFGLYSYDHSCFWISDGCLVLPGNRNISNIIPLQIYKTVNLLIVCDLQIVHELEQIDICSFLGISENLYLQDHIVQPSHTEEFHGTINCNKLSDEIHAIAHSMNIGHELQ